MCWCWWWWYGIHGGSLIPLWTTTGIIHRPGSISRCDDRRVNDGSCAVVLRVCYCCCQSTIVVWIAAAAVAVAINIIVTVVILGLHHGTNELTIPDAIR